MSPLSSAENKRARVVGGKFPRRRVRVRVGRPGLFFCNDMI